MIRIYSDGTVYYEETGMRYGGPPPHKDNMHTNENPSCEDCEYLIHHCEICLEPSCSHSNSGDIDVIVGPGWAPDDCPLRIPKKEEKE